MSSPTKCSISSSALPENIDTTLPIPFPFPLEDNDDANIEERRAFWDSPTVFQWFSERGYTLYKREEEEWGGPAWTTIPALPCETCGNLDYPYPHYNLEERYGLPLAFRTSEIMGKIVYAQDNRNPSHHVAIKLIMTDSEERRILEFLRSQNLAVLKENCIVPVLDILSNGHFSFAVMPRWGPCLHLPNGGSIKNVVQIMHSMLKAVAFLHKHNIIHRDIKFANVLVSHFSDDTTSYTESAAREQLRSSNSLIYCLFDFDISMMLPPDVDKRYYRLPYRLSWDGTFCQPKDTAQGEFDYNPFAYDVGTLGRAFCIQYQHLSTLIPMFAPFLDRMTTRDISSRFTAAEALDFFESFLPDISADVLELEAPEKPSEPMDQSYDVISRTENSSID
ncbi:hypothetical protein NLJ89_g6887 [Agrocybe chaxingu]|uniref:Protein kinase domain-containing protein n=1 Tax=Agrocybe chaxingu TaxID=84603 RepID=A0A9W8JY99_9AGAR|nr:hypothetical protein NLJ89_g6887 [Agrocybe chaxingu]